MRSNQRGQAALEFLTTYGWAFLVILVMIGALAYFGVINPNKFLPERCTFQQEFTCKDFIAIRSDATKATLKFFIINNLGSGVTSVTFTATLAGSTSPTTCTSAGQISAGESLNVTCTDVAGSYPGTGDKAKFNVKGNYTVAGGLYAKSLQGEIFATLQ